MNKKEKNSKKNESSIYIDENMLQDMYTKYEYIAVNVAVKMYKNYTKKDFTPSIELEDVVQTAKMAIWNAIKKAKKDRNEQQTTQFIYTCVTNSLKKYFKSITKCQAHEISNGSWGLLFEQPSIAKEIKKGNLTNEINVNIFPDAFPDINKFCNYILQGCTKMEALRNIKWTRKKFDEHKDFIEAYLVEKITQREIQ